MKKCDTILVAVDFSDSSDNAFQMALSMARKFEARLIILHVINEPVDLRGFYVPHISFEKLEEEIEEGAKKMMESFCRQNILNFENYESLIVPGLPYEQIIEQAGEHSADLMSSALMEEPVSTMFCLVARRRKLFENLHIRC